VPEAAEASEQWAGEWADDQERIFLVRLNRLLQRTNEKVEAVKKPLLRLLCIDASQWVRT
jgi:hypothetical protein